MVARMAAVVGGARWSAADVADFLGRLLTQPKPQVRFAPPARPLDRAAFARRLTRRGPARRLGAGAADAAASSGAAGCT